jgi:ankyrin repeat protein
MFSKQVQRASANGHSGIVDILLNEGLSPLVVCDEYNSLHAAVDGGWPAVIKLLIDWGVSVECRDMNSNTPLHISVARAHESAVEMLLDNGADVEAQHSSGATALHCAIIHGHSDIVEMLLKRGASTNISVHQGSSMIHSAAMLQDCRVMELLHLHGVDIEMRTTGTLQTPLILVNQLQVARVFLNLSKPSFASAEVVIVVF